MRFAIFVLSLFCVVILFFATMSYSKHRKNVIDRFVNLTKLPSIALSTTYLENRVIYYEDFSNILYPKMKYNFRMDFVYSK